MRRLRLKALLGTCPPSIVFDGRARRLPIEDGDTQSEPQTLQPFFEHSLFKNAMLLKTIGRTAADMPANVVQTRAYFPFDPKYPGNGGVSMPCDGELTLATVEKFMSSKIDPTVIEGDLRKIHVMAKLPSFSPFLLRDAFERAALKVDQRHFRVSDAEADAMRDTLKSKLKPLAAMALALPANSVGDTRLDMLARKLWELDDPSFLGAFGQALKIPEGQTIDVLYAWIGVSFFQREFAKRQPKLRELAEWLGAKPQLGELRDEKARQIEADRGQVRDSLRWAWSQAGAVFDRYSSSYDTLISKSDAKPFVEYLQNVRVDFQILGARLALIEQCLCVHGVAAAQERGSQVAVEILQDLAASLRDGGDRDLAAA
ncbi:MAG: hypothetical protein SGI91_23395 [Alphaproteobacteria bacterium]|jgi:hypothetical protein|nr:hypothetical protein [Alphaproteobacteria bacterium]